MQAIFGASIAFGSAMELAATIPGVMPDEVLAELARLHVSPWVGGWVLVQNLATLPLGLAMLAAGVGLWRRNPAAVPLTRRCATTFLAIMVCGQLVLALHLYPDLRSGALGIPDGEAWVVALVLAGIGATLWPALTLLLTRPARSP